MRKGRRDPGPSGMQALGLFPSARESNTETVIYQGFLVGAVPITRQSLWKEHPHSQHHTGPFPLEVG